jgi:hypothetical protein
MICGDISMSLAERCCIPLVIFLQRARTRLQVSLISWSSFASGGGSSLRLRPFQNQGDRAVDFTFNRAQFVFDVLRSTQFARPCAGRKLPRSMGRPAGGISEHRHFLESRFKRLITAENGDVANRYR